MIPQGLEYEKLYTVLVFKNICGNRVVSSLRASSEIKEIMNVTQEPITKKACIRRFHYDVTNDPPRGELRIKSSLHITRHARTLLSLFLKRPHSSTHKHPIDKVLQYQFYFLARSRYEYK